MALIVTTHFLKHSYVTEPNISMKCIDIFFKHTMHKFSFQIFRFNVNFAFLLIKQALIFHFPALTIY